MKNALCIPLCDHALFLVVNQKNLHTDAELSSSGKLSKGHVEGGVTVNVDNQAVRTSHLGTNGGRQTVTHGTKTTRGDHGTGVAPAEVLGSPHLVLTDTGCDDSLVLHVRSEVTELLNDALGLDGTVIDLALVEGQGEAGLPVVDLLEPLLTLSHSIDMRHETAKIVGAVTLDGLGGLNDLVDVLGHDLEVHNTTTALSSRGLGLRSKLGDAQCDTIIETGTKGDDQIGLLHGHVGVSRSVHTEHVEGLGVQLVKATETLEGGGDGNLSLFGKLLQDLRTIRTGEETLTDVEHGLFSHVHQTGNAANGLIERFLAHITSSHGSSSREGGDSAVHRDRVAEDASGDILGQVDEDGTGAAAGSDFEGLLDAARELTNGLDHHVPLGAGTRDTDHVGLLEGVGADSAGGDLTTEDNHGGTVGESILHGSNNVGSAGTGSDKNHTGQSGGTSVALSHVTSTLFMLGENEVEVL